MQSRQEWFASKDRLEVIRKTVTYGGLPNSHVRPSHKRMILRQHQRSIVERAQVPPSQVL